jgi:hypothetical protein
MKITILCFTITNPVGDFHCQGLTFYESDTTVGVIRPDNSDLASEFVNFAMLVQVLMHNLG